MFRLHLVLSERSESLLELRLPATFRIAFLIIAVILIASMATLEVVTPVPLIITAITVLAGLYEERWQFDREAGTVVHRYGLIILAKQSVVPFDQIDTFVLSNLREIPDEGPFSARRSVALRSLVSFQLLTTDGKYRTVEIRPNRHNDSLKQNAERIAEFCGTDLELTG